MEQNARGKEMNRYIDADTLYVKVKAECNPYGKPTISFDDGCKVLDMIRRTPTADVAPVTHAHWEYRYDTGIYQTEFLCSRCKGLIETYSCTVDEVEYEYCPHCGAKMDEEAE